MRTFGGQPGGRGARAACARAARRRAKSRKPQPQRGPHSSQSPVWRQRDRANSRSEGGNGPGLSRHSNRRLGDARGCGFERVPPTFGSVFVPATLKMGPRHASVAVIAVGADAHTSAASRKWCAHSHRSDWHARCRWTRSGASPRCTYTSPARALAFHPCTRSIACAERNVVRGPPSTLTRGKSLAHSHRPDWHGCCFWNRSRDPPRCTYTSPV